MEASIGNKLRSSLRSLMTQRPKSRIFRKYVTIFVALVGAALLTSGLIDLFFSYQEKRDVLATIERERAATAAVMIERFIDGIVEQIQGDAMTPLRGTQLGLAKRRADLNSLLKHVPAITDVSYIDDTGKQQILISRIGISVIGGDQTDFAEEPRFQQAKDHNTYFSPVYFRNESEPYLTIAVAERGEKGGWWWRR